MYVLASIILAYCAIGVFSLHNITFDIWVMFGFGVIGYFMRKLGFPLANSKHAEEVVASLNSKREKK